MPCLHYSCLLIRSAVLYGEPVHLFAENHRVFSLKCCMLLCRVNRSLLDSAITVQLECVLTFSVCSQSDIRHLSKKCNLTVDSVGGNADFYRAMLSMRGTSHGPVSRPSVCPSVCVCLSQVGVLRRSSAIAAGPRDASCQLKSCQLPRNSAETTCTTGPEQIEVMNLEG